MNLKRAVELFCVSFLFAKLITKIARSWSRLPSLSWDCLRSRTVRLFACREVFIRGFSSLWLTFDSTFPVLHEEGHVYNLISFFFNLERDHTAIGKTQAEADSLIRLQWASCDSRRSWGEFVSREVVSAYVKRSSSERSPSLNLLSQFSRLFSSSFWVIFHSFKSTCTMLFLSTSCSLYGGYSNTASTHTAEHERKGRGNSIKKKEKSWIRCWYKTWKQDRVGNQFVSSLCSKQLSLAMNPMQVKLLLKINQSEGEWQQS